MAVNWGGPIYLMNFGHAINIDYVRSNDKEFISICQVKPICLILNK